MYNSQENNIDLVREYIPSYHTTRFQDHDEPNIAVQNHFIDLTTKHYNELNRQTDIKVHNFRYAGVDDRQVVDVYYKDKVQSDQPSPLFVNVHGGYWQMLSKTNACSAVVSLVHHGYRVAVMDYNNCPQVTLEQLLKQFTEFLLWIFDYADRTHTTEINFAGHSAGAHLIAKLLQISSLITPERRLKVRNIFFICGVYDLRELWTLEPVNPNNIFGLNYNTTKELSPILWNWDDKVESWSHTKCHVLTAEHESVTFIEQSRFFANKLQEAEFDVSFKLFEKYDHFDIIEDTVNDSSPIMKYLRGALQWRDQPISNKQSPIS